VLTTMCSGFISVINYCMHVPMVVQYVYQSTTSRQAASRPFALVSRAESVAKLGRAGEIL